MQVRVRWAGDVVPVIGTHQSNHSECEGEVAAAVAMAAAVAAILPLHLLHESI